MGTGSNFNQGPPPVMQQQQQYQQHERSYSQNGPPGSSYNQGSVGRAGNGNSLPNQPPSSFISSGPPQLQTLPFQTSTPLSQSFQQSASPVQQSPVKQQQPPQPYASQQSSQPYGGHQPRPSATDPGNLPPLKPVFGLTLDQLFDRDGSAVPMVVYQCIQAVDLYGLEVEGIYRVSGTGSHVNKIKAMFDNGKPASPSQPILNSTLSFPSYQYSKLTQKQTPRSSTSATPKPSSSTSIPSPLSSSNSSATSPTPS